MLLALQITGGICLIAGNHHHIEILLYAFDKIHGHRRLHYANFQALELCNFSLVSVIKNERIYVDTHSCQKYIYKHIYVFIYNKEKWLNFIYLKIRPFSTFFFPILSHTVSLLDSFPCFKITLVLSVLVIQTSRENSKASRSPK